MAVKTLLCLGDSITDCGRLFDFPPLGNGYVSMLHDRLNHSAETIWKTINKGFDGFTVSRVLEQIESDSCIYTADIITLLIGINDIGLMMNTNRTAVQKESMLQTFVNNYRRLLSVLSRTQAQILLMEPFIFPVPAGYQTWQPYVKRMSDSIKKLAEEFNVPYIGLQSPLLELCNQFGVSRVTTDGIHITALGHELLTAALLSSEFIQ
ncbi:MAG: GDSL-type esterase/lipase family protein [Eubacteriales bacterium]|nr:GDSL-type esterase/lipase family protein [Eubacteriales bacterium]